MSFRSLRRCFNFYIIIITPAKERMAPLLCASGPYYIPWLRAQLQSSCITYSVRSTYNFSLQSLRLYDWNDLPQLGVQWMLVPNCRISPISCWFPSPWGKTAGKTPVAKSVRCPHAHHLLLLFPFSFSYYLFRLSCALYTPNHKLWLNAGK